MSTSPTAPQSTPDTAGTPEETPMSDGLIDVCALEQLMPERGAGALVGEHPVAVFRLADASVRAVQQLDPYCGANVISRGIVGSHDVTDEDGTVRTIPTVTSPMYKQVWDLDTGAVLDAAGKEDFPLAVHEAEVREGRVLVSPQPRAAAVPEPA